MASIRKQRPKPIVFIRITNRFIPIWLMLLTFFFATAAGAFATNALICNRKWRKSKIEQKRLEKELAESKGECLWQKEVLKSKDEALHDYKHLLMVGDRNLKVRSCVLPHKIDNIHGTVCVVGCDTRRSDLYFIIKSIPYDANDPNGYDFAMRQAEELIETIQSI